MSKGNPQKKKIWQDNFIKHWTTSANNHPEGWAWWKKKNRKLFRLKDKQELEKEILENQYLTLTDENDLEYQVKTFSR